LSRRHAALYLQKFYCVGCKTFKKQASVHTFEAWGAVESGGCRKQSAKSFNLSQSGGGGILKNEPAVVEMTNEQSSAPGEAKTQPTFGRLASQICPFVVGENT